MQSGPIILLIVALWAAVLVPALLRRHDESTESKSVDRFTRAMRTLRRDVTLPADDRTVLMPHRPMSAIAPQLFSKSDRVTPAGRRGSRAVPAAPARPDRNATVNSTVNSRRPAAAPRRPAVNASLIARRRRALRTLAIAVAATFLIALVAGGISWLLQGLVDGAAAVYVVHLRAEAKRAQQLARRRPRRTTAVVVPERAAADNVPTATAEAALYHRVTFEEPAVDGNAERADAEVDTSRAWQPIPVPVPTYVTAPKAPRRGKQIEVPPSWSDGLRDDGAEIDLTALERIEPEIDRLIERRRAVND
ncbi:MAG: hypothetical protein JWM93_2257 [Frankiales bacterium]|nr:hypothetical protein [Frankiales bacterium]